MSLHYPVNVEKTHETPAPGLLLGPISHLAREKKTWTPALLAGVLWRGLTNIGRHRRVAEVLRYSEYSELVQSNPRFSFKILTDGYLSRRFSVAQRAACFTHHYQVMRNLLPGNFLDTILTRDIPLIQIEEADKCYSITFGFSRTHDKEGELSLNFQVDGNTVFIMSFTIVPGKVVKSSFPDVLLITRIQGVKGCYGPISAATKSLHDIAPAALLLAALQGIGEALDMHSLACIPGADQNSYCEEWDHSFVTAYDHFFAELGVQKNSAGLFLTDIPIKEKPLVLIKHGHKLRTRAKREFKREILEQVSYLVSGNCQGRSPEVQRLHVEPVAEEA